MFSNKILKALPGRVVSAIIDQISLAMSVIIFSVAEEFWSTPEDIKKVKLNTAIILFAIFLNKDIYFGKSIGKYFFGLRVVSSKTGNPAGPIQCLIRNVFLLLWPIEGLMLFLSPQRRLGDIIAGTKVLEHTEISPEDKWSYVQGILSVIASFTIVYYLFNFIDSLQIMN